MRQPSILIAEDENRTRTDLAQALRSAGFVVEDVENGALALERLRQRSFDLVLSDHQMPRMDGLELLRRVRESLDVPFILYSAVAGSDTVFNAGRYGAVEFLEFPFAVDEALMPTIRRCLRSNAGPESRPTGSARVLGRSEAADRVRAIARRVAKSRASVLITGESGVGKEVVAQAIHEESGRSNLLAVAVPEMPSTLLEAELFGHEKGAFTGAVSSRVGLLERANRGTLLLDEIGDASLSAQAKLLRTLETGEFRRVGSTETRTTDVRLIAATHRDLQEWSRQGRFREDLYFRIGQVIVSIPPLRDRPEDVEPIAAMFLEELAVELQIDPPPMTPEFVDALERQPWRGNARELRAVLQSVLLWWDGGELSSLHALEAVATGSSSLGAEDRVCCQQMLDAYRHAGRNQEAARASLGLTRGQWRYRWDRFGLDILSRRRK